MNDTGRRTEFQLDNPKIGCHDYPIFLVSDRPELLEIPETIEGVSARVDHLDTLHECIFRIDPNYDIETVWLNVYWALEAVAKIPASAYRWGREEGAHGR